MEANSEKTPMIATTCEMRGTDFQDFALGRLTGELWVRFKIVLVFNSGTHNLTFPLFNSGDERHR